MIQTLLTLRPRQKRAIFMVIDLSVVPLCFMLSTYLQHGRAAWFNMPDPLVIVALMAMAAIASQAMGIYRIKLKTFERTAVGRMAIASALLACASWIVMETAAPATPLRHHILFGITHFLAVVGLRAVMLELLLAAYRNVSDCKGVLIYGAGKTGAQLAAAIRAHPDLRPLAFLDDNPALVGQIVQGLHVHPGAQLERIANRAKPHRIFVAMPSTDRKKTAQIEQRIKAMDIEFRSIPSFSQLIGENPAIADASAFLGRDHVQTATKADPALYTGKTILVTGAGGTIGSELCRQLLDLKPAQLILLDHSEHALYAIHTELTQADPSIQITPLLVSICDKAAINRMMKIAAIDTVFHAAAYKHVPLVEQNPMTGLTNNALGTLILATAASAAKIPHFVLVSSDKAVDPASVMGFSKHLSEQIIRDLASRHAATTFGIVRFGNVLGSSGSVVPLFQEQVARGGPVTLTDPHATRYFMTVQEATQLILTTAGLGHSGDIFVLDMGAPISIHNLARNVIESAGLTVRDAAHPLGDIEIIETGLRPGEKQHETLTNGIKTQVNGHPKIFHVQEALRSQFEIARMMRWLEDAAQMSDTPDIARVIADWQHPARAPVRTY